MFSNRKGISVACNLVRYLSKKRIFLFGVCKEIPIRGFDLLQSCTTQRQAGIFANFFFTNDEHAQRDVFPLVELSPRL